MNTIEERRNGRRRRTAEVFTPNAIVNSLLDKMPKNIWEKGKTFCDPACGNGNFLIHILWRKIAKGHNVLGALKTIYGADIMRDNIRECRLRLLKIVSLFEPITEDHIKAVFKNIVFLNRKKYPNGSLDYAFSFKTKYNQRNVDEWLEAIERGMLEEVDLPVFEERFDNGSIDVFDDIDDEPS